MKNGTYRIITEHVVIHLPPSGASPAAARRVLQYRQTEVVGIEAALALLTNFAADGDCTEATLFTKDWRQLIQIPRRI